MKKQNKDFENSKVFINIPDLFINDTSKAIAKARKAAVRAAIKALPKEERTYQNVKSALESSAELLNDLKVGL